MQIDTFRLSTGGTVMAIHSLSFSRLLLMMAIALLQQCNAFGQLVGVAPPIDQATPTRVTFDSLSAFDRQQLLNICCCVGSGDFISLSRHEADRPRIRGHITHLAPAGSVPGGQ